MQPVNIIETDVLVTGGGYAGLLAALAAKADGNRVTVMEKAYAGNSGCAKFAAGDIQGWMPGDDLRQWIGNLLAAGSYLNDPAWLEYNIPFSYDILRELDSWGMPFLKENGSFKRKPGRGDAKSVLINTTSMLGLLRSRCQDQGIQILDRTPMLDLIVQDGQAAGAIGLNIRTNTCCYVLAKAVILANGACAYKGPYFGMAMVTGDGMGAALRAGARLMNMEYGNKYQSTHRDYNIYGMNRFARLGGVFTNNRGERFMERYDPELKDGTTLDVLAFAMASEALAGRAPIEFDLSALPEEDRRITRKLLGPLSAGLATLDTDFFGGKMEWIPAFTGTMGSTSAGVMIDRDGRTSIPRLWAAGDTASKAYFVGAQIGAGGAGMAFAGMTAFRSGQAARQFAAQAAPPARPGEREAAAAAAACSRYLRPDGARPDDVILKIQAVMFRADVSIIRRADRLAKALDTVRACRQDCADLAAADPHELVKAYEAINMRDLAEATLLAALDRRESRGGHFREDFPAQDDAWLQRIIVWQQGGELQLAYEPVDRAGMARYARPQ